MLSVSFLNLALTTPIFADEIPLTSLNLVGNSPNTSQLVVNSQNQTVLRLTPNYDTNVGGGPPAGAAWTKSTYDVAGPFSVNFQFQMSDPCIGDGSAGSCISDLGHGGDGIAFVIQDSSSSGPFSTGFGDTALGEGAGGMGFLGIKDSVAVMLDTYQNVGDPDSYGDPSNNYIAVNTRKTDFNVPHHFCTDGQLTDQPGSLSDLPIPYGGCTASPTLGMSTVPLTDNMDLGVHNVEIIYTGSMLDVYLDSVLYLSVAIDLATALDLQGGDGAFLGFTAGTRFAYQNQDILSFSESPIPEPAWGQLWVPLAMLIAVALGRKWKRARP
jgi:hypothetical protein